jgi:glyoxylate reductase
VVNFGLKVRANETMKIYFTRDIPETAYHMLRDAGHAVLVNGNNCVLTREELLVEIAKVQPDALVATVDDKVDAVTLDAAGAQLQIVANYAVGYNNVDLAECKKRGIVVTNTPDVLTNAVAEHAVALMLTLGRKILPADKTARSGAFTCWEPMGFLGVEFGGKTLGLLGAGRIGSRMAQICSRGFNMPVCYYDVKRNEQLEKDLQASGDAYFCASPDTVLKQADVVSVHVPLLPTTQHMLDAVHLDMMKKTALLINTSRGPIVDEVALVAALQQGRIAGAALDVFEKEPVLTPGLGDLTNVVLTPHIASATTEARYGMAEIVAKNILAKFGGMMVPNEVKV